MLLNDPGAAWTKEPDIDWLARIIRQQGGKRPGEVMMARIFKPLGMTDVAFTLTDSMKSRLAMLRGCAQASTGSCRCPI